MIADEYTFPARSFAAARSLFRIHCVGRGCAQFSSAHFLVVPSGKGDGDDGVAGVRLVPRPVLRPVFSFRLYVRCSLFIHTVASKMTAAFPVSLLALCHVPSKPLPPLPVASFASLIRLVPRPALRLVARLVLMPSRRPSRSHPVPSCPMCRTACLPSCGRAVLFSSFRRSPYDLSSSSPHDRMTQDGNGYRIMATKRTSNRRTSRRKRAAYLYRVDIGTRHTAGTSYPNQQGKMRKTNGKETRRASKTPQQDDMTRRKDRDTGIGRDATRDTQNEKNGTSKQD